MTDGRNPERAFRWIVGLLEELAIPFLLVGGLAARAYGASRELADIDFYVPGERLLQIARAASEFVTAGPERAVSGYWDITFMKLEYAGQSIELGAAEDVRIRNGAAGQWVREPVDLGAGELKEIFGLRVPVMTRERLLAYKRRLRRPVDLADIEDLET
ncbi:MAG TPA: hypothetical protein VK845_11655 [Gemmatimonadales bacterium]|nr:hypothetical protein [Gemmatimonadales bacterium]